MKQFWKKSLAALLALLMVLTMAPLAVFAGDGDTTPPADQTGTETPPATEPHLKHSFETDPMPAPDIPAKQPTCTEDGHGRGWTCSVCGYVMYEDGNYKAKGHDWQLKETITAACGVEGSAYGLQVLPAATRPKNATRSPRSSTSGANGKRSRSRTAAPSPAKGRDTAPARAATALSMK